MTESKEGAPIPSLSIENLQSISKFPSRFLDAYIGRVTTAQKLSNTATTVHCHYILCDGNKRPRVDDLARALSRHLVDFAIPRSKRDEAAAFYEKTKSTSKFYELQKQAETLFSDLAKTGEGGELLLYLLAETYLQLPQIICKMSLKTNARMHVHGSDGVHAKYDASKKKLGLYWCESKLYGSLSSALSKCFESLAPFLVSPGGSTSAQERDLQLLRDFVDLNDADLEAALLQFLDPDDASFNRLEYRAICLIGFDSDVYPAEPTLRESEEIRAELAKVTADWSKSIAGHISSNKLATFEIEAICLPFPSVENFRKAFLTELGYR